MRSVGNLRSTRKLRTVKFRALGSLVLALRLFVAICAVHEDESYYSITYYTRWIGIVLISLIGLTDF